MSNDTDPPKAAKSASKPVKLPALEERRLRFDELAPHGAGLEVSALIDMLRDGRAMVRANAALGLAAAGHAAVDLVLLLRDSEASVAAAAAESISRLGLIVRPVVSQITQALDSTQPDVTETVVTALSQLIGKADDELSAALDVPFELAMKSIVAACGKVGEAGVAFLIKAAKHERGRIRINAVGGLAKLGKADLETAMAFLTQVEANDPLPDVRTAAKRAMLAVIAREKVEVVDGLPKNVPDFEARKLSSSEIAEYADVIDVDQMIYALQDGRNHVKINAARCLAAKRDKAGRAAKSVGLLLRDSIPSVRQEAAKALGKLGKEAVDAAPDLVGALGDVESDVAESAAETLAAMGEAALDALVRGLETGSVEGGRRVGELIGHLPNASKILTEAFRTSPAVNVQVNAATGLGLLGASGVGAGLQALHGARTGGDARTRDAVRKALDLLEAKAASGPKQVAIEGFEERFLAAADIEKHKAEIANVGAGDFTAHLTDGRDFVRANSAIALGLLGPAAAGSALSLGVLLRDDAARVRLAAAQALDKIGDAAVVETADYLVGALGDNDPKVAETCATVLRARKGRMISALVRGLETDKPGHGKRIVELINVFDDAVEILCDAFESPAVNVQVNAALGLGLLGPKRVGKGRKALEGARTGGRERTREEVRKALDTLDGPRSTGPGDIKVDGFETRLLGPEAFDAGKLDGNDLLAHLQDGRAIVRANAATALGVLGPVAAGAATAIGVLARDDDMQVRIRAAMAIDKLGDDSVRETAPFLVGALRGDADVAKAVATVLGARKAKVLTALVKGLDTDDEPHARRILELINALPDACEILCDAFESPAENIQVNAAIGIGMLGTKRAGTTGKKKLEGARTGGFARTREAVFKALAMLKDLP